MNEEKKIKRIFKKRKILGQNYEKLLDIIEDNLDFFLNLTYDIKVKNFGHVIKVYIPDTKFPAISITGTACALNCEHCNTKYLKGMKPITNKLELEDFLVSHFENGGVGALISGGCDLNGKVPLNDFIESIKKVKSRTDLIINVHTGLLNAETSKALSKAGVDIISFDVNADNNIIKEIYHLNKNVDDYKRSIQSLKKNGLKIVPHVCIGLYYGKLHHELKSLKFIKKILPNPDLIVLIALIPPKDPLNKFKTPNPKDIGKVIGITRILFPKTEISLGCMRPRGSIKIEIEKLAFKAGITRIEIPSKETLRWMREIDPMIKFEYYSACCAIPKSYEKQARSNIREIKGFLV